jgi:protein-S-isoprenylcysteine O-methyltransferase Ste14
MWVRHLFAIVVLPFTVTVVVPVWIARRHDVALGLGETIPRILAQLSGLVLIVVGLVFFAASLRRFATEGLGTLAPWDPPRRLVVRGPYRYVRHPMISGVALVVFGEALVLLSGAHLAWAALFLAVNLLYIPAVEEPGLRRRFGEAYIEYARHVPGLVPRLRPWTPDREE